MVIMTSITQLFRLVTDPKFATSKFSFLDMNSFKVCEVNNPFYFPFSDTLNTI